MHEYVHISAPQFGGLADVDAGDLLARTEWLADADPLSLVEPLVAWMLALRETAPVACETLAKLTGLPVGEIAASPYALRAVALAAARGVYVVDHELRVDTGWTERSHDERVRDPMHAVWDRGVLHIGKYQSFLQDEPAIVFNPTHMSKWTPHECLHRATGFLWRADMSRFELYIGARLNELGPVALWYGADELARLDRTGFVRLDDAASPRARVDRAMWLHESAESLRSRVQATVNHVQYGAQHFLRDIRAIDLEIESLNVHATPVDGLDGSSDAIAYVAGHIDRLREIGVSRFIERCLVANEDYDTECHLYRARVCRSWDQLLFEPLTIDVVAAKLAKTRRQLWDIAQRIAHTGPDGNRRLRRKMDDVRAALRDGTRETTQATLADLEALGGSAVDGAMCSGEMCSGAHVLRSDARSQLEDGVRSYAPATLLAAPDLITNLDLGVLRQRGSLPHRLQASVDGHDAALGALHAFETTLAMVSPDSGTDDVLADEPDRPDSATTRVVRRAGISRIEVDPRVVEWHWKLVNGETPNDLPTLPLVPRAHLAGMVDESFVLVPIETAVVHLWEVLQGAPQPVDQALSLLTDKTPQDLSAEEWLDELLGAGVVVLRSVGP